MFLHYKSFNLPSPLGGFDFLWQRPLVMGILNCTPDSFHAQSRPAGLSRIIDAVGLMIDQGADCIDIGGESTRPGATEVSLQEEMDRVLPVIEAIKSHYSIPLSLDSRTPEVISAGLMAGVDIINSQDALESPEARKIVAEADCPVILMHQSSSPSQMEYAQAMDRHFDVVAEVLEFFKGRIAELKTEGISDSNIILDPGFAFGKTPQNCFKLLKGIQALKALGYPVLVGVSRKSPIGWAVGGAPVAERAEGSLVADMVGALYGVNIIRTHDVRQAVQGLAVLSAIKEA